MAKVRVGGPFSFRKVEDPFDFRERGWEVLDPFVADGTTMSLPSWLTFMCGRSYVHGAVGGYGGRAERQCAAHSRYLQQDRGPGVCEQAVLGGHNVVTQPRGRGRGTVRLACGQRGHARPMVAGAERIITGQ